MVMLTKLAMKIVILCIGSFSVVGRHVVDAATTGPTDHEKVVYIIRHGEKIYTGDSKKEQEAYQRACESEEGWSRAYSLLHTFGTSNPQGFVTPQALFSYDYYQTDCRTSAGYYRTQSTIAPLGAMLGIDINNTTGSFPELCGYSYGADDCKHPEKGKSVHAVGMCCNVAAAKAIKDVLFSKTCGNKGQEQCTNEIRSVLVAWEHANIAFLAQALGGDATFSWPGWQFDQVVAIYFDTNTEAFTRMEPDLRQGFKWIGPNKAHLGSSVSDLEEFGPGEHPHVN